MVAAVTQRHAIDRADSLDPRSLERSEQMLLGPWAIEHLFGVVAANLVGVCLAVAGWWGTSVSRSEGAAFGWLNLGVVGVLVVGLGNGWWLARGRRIVSLARRQVLRSPQLAPAVASCAGARVRRGDREIDGTVRAAQPVSNGQLVASPNMSLYHRDSCRLAQAKDVRVASRSRHERDGRTPCEVCLP